MFQKVVLADVLLYGVSDTVFGSSDALHTLDAWTGTLAFSGQIFFDFAGYSTCAIGIALMLGIQLPHNFLYPYGAIGFSDLWKHWHITLSSWLRDYLYFPLGGNRVSTPRMYANLMITMLLGGLWHGAAWTFVVWGGLHGSYLIIERLLRKYITLKINFWNGWFFALLTYTAVNITWVFFRAEEFGTAWQILGSMFGWVSNGEKVLFSAQIVQVFLIVGLLFITHYLMRDRTLKSLAERYSSWTMGVVWAIMIVLLIIAQGSGEQFIYFQF